MQRPPASLIRSSEVGCSLGDTISATVVEPRLSSAGIIAQRAAQRAL